MRHDKATIIELDEKGHLTVTMIFAHELHKHNIANDKIQNQKIQHYISFVETKTEMWNWQLVADCSTDTRSVKKFCRTPLVHRISRL